VRSYEKLEKAIAVGQEVFEKTVAAADEKFEKTVADILADDVPEQDVQKMLNARSRF